MPFELLLVSGRLPRLAPDDRLLRDLIGDGTRRTLRVSRCAAYHLAQNRVRSRSCRRDRQASSRWRQHSSPSSDTNASTMPPLSMWSDYIARSTRARQGGVVWECISPSAAIGHDGCLGAPATTDLVGGHAANGIWCFMEVRRVHRALRGRLLQRRRRLDSWRVEIDVQRRRDPPAARHAGRDLV